MGNSGKWSEDVTEREIPKTRLVAAGLLVSALVIAGVIAWELQMRSLGLIAGDLDDSRADWAVERRKVAVGDYDNVVLIGSSRIVFDTNLDVWQEMTGRRPIQLALPGTSPRLFLADLADDQDFRGLLIIDITPEIYFSDRPGLNQFLGVLDYWKSQSPSERFGHQVGLILSRYLAFLDDQYTLISLIDQVDLPNRGTITRPYLSVWKLAENYEDRQYVMWRRLESDARLLDHAKRVWMSSDRKPPKAELIAEVCDEARINVARIRARGGEVIFVRPPSTGAYYAREERNVPRTKTWDRLLRETGALGIHFDDYPEMQGLELPEMSHLSRDSATRFTRAYVAVIRQNVPWLGSPAAPASTPGDNHG